MSETAMNKTNEENQAVDEKRERKHKIKVRYLGPIPESEKRWRTFISSTGEVTREWV